MADRLRLCVPRELWPYKQWLVWRYEAGQDKPRKVPYYVSGQRRSGMQGASADLANLSTFEAAEELFRAGGYDGVGLAILDSSPIKAIDLDACVSANGAIDAEAEAILNQADSYSELSPSRGGVRILVYGSMPSLKAMNKFGPGRHLELFGTSGFVTITGNVLGESVIRPMEPDFRNWLCSQAGAVTHAEPAREVPAQVVDATQVEHLRSALAKLDHSNYDQWIRDGIALKCLGSVGFDLWVEYGQRFDGFDMNQAHRKWAGFAPVRADFRSIFKRAQDKGWVNPNSKAAQPTLPPEVVAGQVELVKTLEQLGASAAAVRWQVKHYIEQGALGMIFGASGTFKSFIALDLALHIAHGMPWLGRKTNAGRVVYVAAEGGSGLFRRVVAWHQRRDLKMPADTFFVCDRAIVMNDSQAVDTLRASIERVCPDPVLVVVDTLSQTFSGNENSNDEMAGFFRAIKTGLMEPLHCGALVIHHSGHSATERPRGASAIVGNVDYLYGVFRDPTAMLATVECHKQKEGDKPGLTPFVLDVEQLGQDEDGEAINSLVATFADTTGSTLLQKNDEKLSKRQKEFISLVRELGNEEQVRKEFYKLVGGNAAANRQAFNRARDELLKLNVIEGGPGGALSVRQEA